MSCPLASTDGMVLACQSVFRNTVKALLRILKVGGREHTISPGNIHVIWVGMGSAIRSFGLPQNHTVIGPQNPEPRLERGTRTQSTQVRTQTLRSKSKSTPGDQTRGPRARKQVRPKYSRVRGEGHRLESSGDRECWDVYAVGEIEDGPMPLGNT